VHDSQLWCRDCHYGAPDARPRSAGVIDDSIPGGILIHHGICNDDGTPKRYYSKSEIHRAAFEKNVFIVGDTPKPNPKFQEAEARRKERG
jgi:hypothetical protein